LDEERLPAGEGELAHAKLHTLVDEGLQVLEAHAPEAPITGPRAFQTERAGEIARRAGVKPQLRERVRLDVAARIPQRGEQPLVAGQARAGRIARTHCRASRAREARYQRSSVAGSMPSRYASARVRLRSVRRSSPSRCQRRSETVIGRGRATKRRVRRRARTSATSSNSGCGPIPGLAS